LGFGVGGRGLGLGAMAPNPQPPIPNPQSPIPNLKNILLIIILLFNKNKYLLFINIILLFINFTY